MAAPFDFHIAKPALALAPYVESFWSLYNDTGADREIVILPDGRIDLTFFQTPGQPFRIILSGLETQHDRATLQSGSRIFAISFRLLATEYILHDSISHLLDYATELPADFWGFHEGDMDDFSLFCSKASDKILSLLPPDIDSRKQELFDSIYATDGSVTVSELSEKVYWSSRQINRYFRQQYGLTLKAYCSILRFRASFEHLHEGELFPQRYFADQSHFIKEVKKHAGVSPKELSRNDNDRFIQLSILGRR